VPRFLASFDTGEINLTSLKTVAVAALLSAMTPVFAQAAIQEPGMFAFHHPYLDVLNGGAPHTGGQTCLRAAYGHGGLCGQGERYSSFRRRFPRAALSVLRSCIARFPW
jgi:hypothetical protein